jgi:predicted DNA-binding ribbon-helix-helix protein
LQPALAKATKTIISSDKHAIHQTEISVEQVKIWIFCAACQKKEYRVAEIVDEIKSNHPPPYSLGDNLVSSLRCDFLRDLETISGTTVQRCKTHLSNLVFGSLGF